MLQPCILEPTRIVNHQNPALIDNIFINIVEKNVKSGNLTSSISDHLPNYVTISEKGEMEKKASRSNPLEDRWELAVRIKEILSENDEKWRNIEKEREEARAAREC